MLQKLFLNLILFTFFFQFSAFSAEVIAVYPEHFPPYYFKDSHGDTTGLGVDVLQKVAEKTGLKITMKPVADWQTALKMIKTGKAQLLPNIGMSDEHSDFMRYSVPIDVSTISIVTRRSSHIKSENDLKGEVVATLSFSVAHNLMRKRKDITLITTEDPAGLMYLLMSGQADAVIFAKLPVSQLISTMNLGKDITIIEPPIIDIKRAVGVTINDTELYFKLNNALSDFVLTDEYRSIYNKWHKVPSSEKSDMGALKVILGITLTIAIILFIWRFITVKKANRQLKEAYDRLNDTKNALEESELKFSAMADSITDIIWFADATLSRMLYINKSYERIYGKTAESLYESPWSYLECVHPDDRGNLTLKTEGAETPKSNIKYRVINKITGDMHWVLSQYYPHKDDSGKTLFIAGIISDITPLVEAENDKAVHQQVLAQQSKFASLGEMIGSISHQWRQPLNTLYLCMQMIDDEIDEENIDKVAIKKYVHDSMKLVEHMSETIDDFRDFFKTNRKQEPFDAPRTVQHILRMISPQLRSHNINFHLDCRCALRSFSCVNNFDPGNPPCQNLVKGISNEFKHAILNLLQNAKEALIHSGEANKDIYITMMSENASFVISIADNAGGIPKELMDKIFDAYITGKEDGTGMGLFMTKTIIEEKMNGTITVENTENGAKFTITLPVIETI